MKNEQSRRKFIKNSAKILATIIGFITFGKYFSFSQTTNEINTISTGSSVKSENQNKILVVYEGQFGSTAEVAKFIGNNLPINDQLIEVKKINEVTDLSSYNKVIIGSAIQYDDWMPKAREFVLINKKTLSELPVAFFFTCLVLSKKTEKAKLQAIGYSDKLKTLVPEISPKSVGQFAGVLDYSKMSFGQRILAKGLFAIIGVKEGDYRDWKAIKEWTEKLEF